MAPRNSPPTFSSSGTSPKPSSVPDPNSNLGSTSPSSSTTRWRTGRTRLPPARREYRIARGSQSGHGGRRRRPSLVNSLGLLEHVGFEIEGGFRGFFCERFLLGEDSGDGESGVGSTTVWGGGGNGYGGFERFEEVEGLGGSGSACLIQH
ncbi:hypothetical protein C1H46_037484 [Malus baccata]|uniref:Uncharacterized protein n=1 Tax=Malus baccata TaxID=106549 RepID=A0A540KRX8_MALBA|nr:hypothetical protein C1H46_037484 [Malus baccata]